MEAIGITVAQAAKRKKCSKSCIHKAIRDKWLSVLIRYGQTIILDPREVAIWKLGTPGRRTNPDKGN